MQTLPRSLRGFVWFKAFCPCGITMIHEARQATGLQLFAIGSRFLNVSYKTGYILSLRSVHAGPFVGLRWSLNLFLHGF